MNDLDAVLSPEEHEKFKARIALERPDLDAAGLEFVARQFAYLVVRGEAPEGKPIFAKL